MFETAWIYFCLLVASGILCFGLAVYIWKVFWQLKRIEAARIFSIILFAIVIWTFGNSFSIISSLEFAPFLWIYIYYIGIILIPPSWMILALSWTGRGKWFTQQNLFLIYLIPLFNIILVFTNEIHHLFWTDMEIVSSQTPIVISSIVGPAWWLHAIYSYVFIGIGTFYLLNGIFHLRYTYQKQAAVLLIGSLVPWILNMIYVFNFTGIIHDPTPIAFLVTGFAFSWGFAHLRLIELTPLAKDEVFERVNDPILLFDNQYHLVECNSAAEQVFQIKGKEIIGKKIETVFHDYPDIINQCKSGEFKGEIHVTQNDNIKYYNVNITKLKHSGRTTGSIISLRDISDVKKASIALRESEGKFRTFTESAAVAIMIYQDDEWIYVNSSAERITEYSKDELIGMNIWECFHPDYKEMAIKNLQAPQKVKSPSDKYEFKIIAKSGKEKWIEYSAGIIEYQNDEAVLVTLIDITDRKKGQELIKKQLTAIKSSMDGVAILDENEKYTYVNEAHAKIYGYDSPDMLIGKSWKMLYKEEELNRFKNEIMPQFYQNGRWRGEAIGKKKDESVFNQELTLTTLTEGGLICVVRDITQQKMVLKELQDAHEVLYTINKDLERKVKQRTKQIERLVKQKDDFINQLGHDLKTPLTPMMVLLPMLKKKVETEKDIELFEVVIRNVFFMKELVNKTIDLAKLSSDKIEFTLEELNLREEVENRILINKILFDEHNISVDNQVQEPILVEADRLRLNEVLNNLITNAVKYSAKDGGQIIFDAQENNNDEIVISIRDTGIGMTEEQISHIFDEFYKADESRHNLDSSGLGLAISKKIINKHDGKIWAESAGPGQGTTFFFTLKKPAIGYIKKEEQEIQQ